MPPTYTPNPKHRNKTVDKSQWQITSIEEEGCFLDAVKNKWYIPRFAWGIYYPHGKLEFLGVGRDHTSPVFIAKFLGDHSNEWHGFPIDHQKDERDIPKPWIVNAWMTMNLLTPAKARKIIKSQPCRLQS